MRKVFKKSGIPQPLFKEVKNLEEAKDAAEQIGYPCVIKAPDSSASRGIVRVNSKKEVSKAFMEASSFSRSSSLLVEEFIEGLEFGAQAFSIDGKCNLVLIHNDQMTAPPYMIPLGHSFPSNLPKKALNKDPNYVSYDYRKEQLWGEKLQKSAEILLQNKQLQKDVILAKSKINISS